MQLVLYVSGVEAWRASVGHFMYMLAVDLPLSLVQQVQHFLNNGLQGPAQDFPTVGIPYRGDMDERRSSTAQV